MNKLTKAEEQVMQYLWKLEKGFLKDIIAEYPDPKPGYTTVSTVIRVLVKKEFIGYNTYGKVHEYFPRVSKEVYFKNHLGGIVEDFFDNSISGFVSCFTDGRDIDIAELEEIKKMVETKIKEKSDGK